jgi:hypothetical protein
VEAVPSQSEFQKDCRTGRNFATAIQVQYAAIKLYGACLRGITNPLVT